MNRRQLEQKRECVEEQLRWALLHDGDQELLDLLRIESDRLLVNIAQCPDRPIGSIDSPQAQLVTRFGRASSGFSSIMRLLRNPSPPLGRE
jgi:hypothetical protein